MWPTGTFRHCTICITFSSEVTCDQCPGEHPQRGAANCLNASKPSKPKLPATWQDVFGSVLGHLSGSNVTLMQTTTKIYLLLKYYILIYRQNMCEMNPLECVFDFANIYN